METIRQTATPSELDDAADLILDSGVEFECRNGRLYAGRTADRGFF